ncbi:DoxX family protein [Actinomadura harenae]|uniref:DoxX family protein n=1 Tax=Actinomadura harenae TaxID=2483351 RepID=A0A3M2LWI4_9ACTN|nr:DoxX family protein [Actinomadura harenae]RMI41486.1 DoxX family protein [Actinomadura harenae]
MSTTYTVVTVLTAAWIGFSAVSLLRRADFVTQPLVEYGVPRTWWTALGTAKALGSLGLLAGLAVPAVGVAAALGLALYFLGAIATVLRVHSYKTLPYPVLYLTLSTTT